MDEQLINRVNLIMNNRFAFIKQKEEPQQQYKQALAFQIICIINMFVAVLCIWSAMQLILNIKNNVPDWESVAMTMAMASPFLLLFPQSFADFQLKKHMIDIIKKRPKCDIESNFDLHKTITLIYNKKRNLPYLLFTMLLLLGSLLKIMDFNSIWNLFAYLAPLCIILIVIRTSINYKIIKNCIARFEKEDNQ